MSLESATTIERLDLAPSPAAPPAIRLTRALFSFPVMLAFGLALITTLTVSTRFNLSLIHI